MQTRIHIAALNWHLAYNRAWSHYLFQVATLPEDLAKLAKGTTRRARLYRKHLQLAEACRNHERVSVATILEAVVTIGSALGQAMPRYWCLCALFSLCFILMFNFNLLQITFGNTQTKKTTNKYSLCSERDMNLSKICKTHINECIQTPTLCTVSKNDAFLHLEMMPFCIWIGTARWVVVFSVELLELRQTKGRPDFF